MTKREVRCSDIPQEWKDRLSRRACPVCGKERVDFDSRHRGYQIKDPSTAQLRHPWDPEKWYGGTPACSKDCTETYWAACKTWQEHRRQLFRERHGICAGCGFPLDEYPKWDKDPREPDAKLIPGRDWVLDHIVPIALGGSMWDPANHQILCEKCNKEKTARDLSMIAAAKRGEKEDTTRQQTLF